MKKVFICLFTVIYFITSSVVFGVSAEVINDKVETKGAYDPSEIVVVLNKDFSTESYEEYFLKFDFGYMISNVSVCFENAEKSNEKSVIAIIELKEEYEKDVLSLVEQIQKLDSVESVDLNYYLDSFDDNYEIFDLELSEQENKAIVKAILEKQSLGYHDDNLNEDDFHINCDYISEDKNLYGFDFEVNGYAYFALLGKEIIGNVVVSYSSISKPTYIYNGNDNKVYSFSEAYDLGIIDDEFLINNYGAHPLIRDVTALVKIRSYIMISLYDTEYDYNKDKRLDIVDIAVLRDYIINA